MDRLQVFYYNLYAVLIPTCPVRTGNMQRHITFAEYPDYLYVKIEAPTEKGYDYAVAIATEAEINAGAACGQLSLLTENE